MTAMRAMNVRLCGLGYVEPTGRKAGTTTSKQQSMRLAMVMGSWVAMGVPDLARAPTTARSKIEEEMRGYPPLLGKFE